MTIYCLELKDAYFYVGMSGNLPSRLEHHFRGEGAAWTRLHPPVCLVEAFDVPHNEAEHREMLVTIECMKQHGWRRVRGGYFVQCDDILTAKKLLVHKQHDLLTPEDFTALGLRA